MEERGAQSWFFFFHSFSIATGQRQRAAFICNSGSELLLFPFLSLSLSIKMRSTLAPRAGGASPFAARSKGAAAMNAAATRRRRTSVAPLSSSSAAMAMRAMATTATVNARPFGASWGLFPFLFSPPASFCQRRKERFCRSACLCIEIRRVRVSKAPFSGRREEGKRRGKKTLAFSSSTSTLLQKLSPPPAFSSSSSRISSSFAHAHKEPGGRSH